MTHRHIVGILMSYTYKHVSHLQIIGPRHEKTFLRVFTNNKGADQPAHPRSLICTSVIHILEVSNLSLLQAKFQSSC